jgi:hypothetical protein
MSMKSFSFLAKSKKISTWGSWSQAWNTSNNVKTYAHLTHLDSKGCCHACVVAQPISTYSIDSINHPIFNELKGKNMCPLQ